jgi:hypothetical protein
VRYKYLLPTFNLKNKDREPFLLTLDEKGKITLLRHDLILMPLLFPNFSKATYGDGAL